MTLYLLNRGRTIFWRRRLPGRAATIFGRSHLTFSLRTRDPKRARQLSRRLAVLFDEVFEIMEQDRRHPTKEQQQAIIQSFKDLVQERIDLRRAISRTPTEEQFEEFLENDPDTEEGIKAIADAEEAFLDRNPDAKADRDERYAAYAATNGFHSLKSLKKAWSDALLRNDTALVAPIMNEALNRNGVALSANSITLALLTRQALQGGIEVLESTIANREASDQGSAIPQLRLKPSPVFSELIDAFFAEKCRTTDDHKGYTAQVEFQNRMTLRLWTDIFEDRPVREYTRAQAGEFRDLLLKLPKDHGKSSKDNASIRELIAWADADPQSAPRLTMKTVKRHFTALRQYWTFLLARGHVNENIFTMFSFPGTSTNKRRRHKWTPEALDKLFHSSWWQPGTDRDTIRWWGPLILLHMGLRREELCQLMSSDVREEDGIPYIDLNTDHGRRLKNESSKRKVPIHRFILELGFLDFVERQRRRRGAVLLFPDINPHAKQGKKGDPFTKAFGRHIRLIGVDDPKIVLHSLRHTFRTDLANKRTLPGRWIDMVMGHEAGTDPSDNALASRAVEEIETKISVGQIIYTEGLELHAANATVQAFVCPVDLTFLKSRK